MLNTKEIIVIHMQNDILYKIIKISLSDMIYDQIDRKIDHLNKLQIIILQEQLYSLNHTIMPIK